MAQVDHLKTGEILGVGLMHQVMFSADVEGELVVGLLVHGPNFLDQRDHIHPFEIVRRRMSEQGFERAEVCAMYCGAPPRGRLLSSVNFIGFHRGSRSFRLVKLPCASARVIGSGVPRSISSATVNPS